MYNFSLLWYNDLSWSSVSNNHFLFGNDQEIEAFFREETGALWVAPQRDTDFETGRDAIRSQKNKGELGAH